MNFGLEIFVSLVIVALVIFFCFRILPRNANVIVFFIDNKKYLSPNCISNWRKYLGAPTVLTFIFAVMVENDLLAYISVWIFVFLAISDLLDGAVARNCNMMTPEGAKLDAQADKWFDLPALFAFCLFPVYEPIYFIIVSCIAIFDIIGQFIRGKNSPPEAGIIGKAKTTVKFICIYLMSFAGRYDEIYQLLKLETVILILLFLALLLAGLSMGMKTKWYHDYIRKYIQDYV
ncbi:MAG: CDP-alcohol phosphatidyltransferase family protein [Candidatus Gracilibacteria bacterium]|nr:CDP-alcohol phosphatidyltransferase family protein [Candidatus Gracilibacteria bacterium]